MNEPLLEIKGLETHFSTDDGMVRAVDGVSLSISRGETLCVVGESGCGKTVTALSVLKLIAMPPGRFVNGQILWQGRDLIPLPIPEMDKIRSKEIAIIFQEPMTSLNPVYTVGEQIAEVVRRHEGVGRKAAIDRTIEMLRLVRIPNPERRVNDYPHQFSGGMRQRVMIAMALSCNPKLLIADEPTTALDVTIQAQILELLQEMKSQFGMAIMLITHAMGVVAETAQRVIVMYAGKVVEEASVEQLFRQSAVIPTRRASSARFRASTRRRYRRSASKRSPAPCRACCARRPAAASPRAAASRPTTASRKCRRCARWSPGTRLRAFFMTKPASPQQPRPHEHRRNRTADDRAAADREQARQTVPDPRRRVLASDRPRARRRWRQLPHREGRDARPGRRIRLRQIHDRTLHPAPDRADLGRGVVRGQGRRGDGQERACVPSPATCRSSFRIRSPRSTHA